MDFLRYEAEDLKLSGSYQAEFNTISSGSKNIFIFVDDNNTTTGTATGSFSGPTGIYEVKLGYYDESDGESPVSVTVDGDTQNLFFDKDLGSAAAVSTTLTESTTHS
ncbi:MAG: hypothetical protein AAFY76_16260, partial [Cyanobacteria bacterium J06649_11]